jgi:hypothetical protein
MRGERWVCVAAAVICLGFAGQSTAADQNQPAGGKNWAIEFRILENLQLGPFESNEVSLKQRLSDASALRYALGLDYEWNNEGQKSDDISTHGSVLYQRYLNPENRARFYWGVGPGFAIAYSYRLDSGSISYIERNFHDYRAAILGMTGVECFVWKAVSIGAEYRDEAVYHWVQEVDYRQANGGPIQRSEYRYREFVLRNSGVLFGVSVYF